MTFEFQHAMKDSPTLDEAAHKARAEIAGRSAKGEMWFGFGAWKK